MERAVNKFIAYLEVTEKAMQNKINRQLRRERRESDARDKENLHYRDVRANLINILEQPIDDWKYYHAIITDFGEVTSLFKDAHLKVEEKLTIIVSLIKRNIATGILDFDLNKPNAERAFKNANYAIVMKGVYDKFAKAAFKDKKDLTPEEIDEIYMTIQNNTFAVDDLQGISNNLQLLDNHLIAKMPDLSLEDIKYIVLALQYFKVDEETLNEIAAYLIDSNKKSFMNDQTLRMTALERKDLKIGKVIASDKSKLRVLEKDPSDLTDEERLYKELYHYFNLNRERVLDLDERIKVVRLLQDAGYSYDKIETYLKSLTNPSSLIAQYNLFCEKYRYYIENALINGYRETMEAKKLIANLEYWFARLWLCDEEEYGSIKKHFERCMMNLSKYIPKSYDFEYDRARERKR